MRTSGHKLMLKRKKVKFGNRKSVCVNQRSVCVNLVSIVEQKDALMADFGWVYELRLHYMRERTELDDPEILFSVVSVAWSQ